MDQRQTGSDNSEPKHGTGGKLGAVAGRSDSGKSIMHTIHPKFLTDIGTISEFGARKYHMRNFLMTPGMQWSRVYESLLRHLFAYWGGEENDEESGLPHLHHAMWNMMVLHQYRAEPAYHAGDDRPSVIEHRGMKWQDWDTAFKEQQTAPAREYRREPRDPEFMKGDARDWFTRGPVVSSRPKESCEEVWEKHTSTFSVEGSMKRISGLATYCVERNKKELVITVDDLVNILKAAKKGNPSDAE